MGEITRQYIIIVLLIINNIFAIRELYLHYKNRKK